MPLHAPAPGSERVENGLHADSSAAADKHLLSAPQLKRLKARQKAVLGYITQLQGRLEGPQDAAAAAPASTLQWHTVRPQVGSSIQSQEDDAHPLLLSASTEMDTKILATTLASFMVQVIALCLEVSNSWPNL